MAGVDGPPGPDARPRRMDLLEAAARLSFAFYAAIGPRCGVETKGPTYVQQAMINAKRWSGAK